MLDRKSYYGTPICAPLKIDPLETMFFATQRSDFYDEGLGHTVKNEVMGR